MTYLPELKEMYSNNFLYFTTLTSSSYYHIWQRKASNTHILTSWEQFSAPRMTEMMNSFLFLFTILLFSPALVIPFYFVPIISYYLITHVQVSCVGSRIRNCVRTHLTTDFHFWLSVH